uniref:Uncharacterized protein n=1 Tax=Podoviridae sp. ctG4L18 TaxID=2825234 RepID=A0A8S5UP53_9CAUD|nr:MAG TPA: hypothetical protein [Podoviridae sp. ctG4L18]
MPLIISRISSKYFFKFYSRDHLVCYIVSYCR